jgi:hypothetical protein
MKAKVRAKITEIVKGTIYDGSSDTQFGSKITISISDEEPDEGSI